MLSRQERKKYCCPTTTSFIIIIICKFVVFIIPFLNFLAFFVFLLSLFFLVWISLDSILFPRCTTLASLGSGYSRILLVIFLPLNTLLFRLPSICSTVIHIFPNFPISQDFHPTAQAHPSTPQNVSFGNHKFFKVCESVSVLRRSSVCPFFRFHVSVKALDVGVSLYG